MFDFVSDNTLLAITIVVPVAMGLFGIWWALRPPEKKRHWLVVVFYGVLAVIGAGAAYLSGTRTSAQQGSIEGGVGSIQQQLERLHLQSRIVVTGAKLIPVKGRSDLHDIRIYQVNRGLLDGYTPIITHAVALGPSNKLRSDIDKALKRARDKAFSKIGGWPSKKKTIEANDQFWTDIGAIDDASWKAIQSEQSVLYLVVIQTFVDDSLPNGTVWVSEYVGVIGKDQTAVNVLQQRTYKKSFKAS